MARGLSLGRRAAVTPISEDELLAADPATAFRVDPTYIGQVLAPPTDVALRPRIGEAPPAAEKPYSPGFLETLDAVLGGETITGARKRLRGEHQAEQEAAAAKARIAGMGLSDLEWLAMQLNPDQFGSALSEHLKPVTLSEGQTHIGRDGAVTAPKVLMDGGYAISASPKGAQVLGQRPMSHQEETDRTMREAEHLRQKLRDAATIRQGDQRIGLQGQALRHRIAQARAAGAGGGKGGLGKSLSNATTADLLAALQGGR